jgi:hypothetical protein
MMCFNIVSCNVSSGFYYIEFVYYKVKRTLLILCLQFTISEDNE